MIIALNCGSSSVKAAWFRSGPDPKRLGSALIKNIGSAQARLRVRYADGKLLLEEPVEALDHADAIDVALTHIETRELTGDIAAIGHRVVHGGEQLTQPCIVDPRRLRELHALIPLAPAHLPQNLAGISAARDRWPDVLQIACFDTAFHRSLPPVARHTGLPRALYANGIRRYGFHGLSYESVLDDLARNDGDSAIAGRIIIAHLGGGASMAAIRNGQCVDTTMGFSTLGGLLMSTRCGDLDPGALLYLLNERIVDVTGITSLLYEQSGLMGVSGISGDMRELLDRQREPAAREAIELFCYSARKHLGALAAVLGGLDRLVFTGGIGENSADVRHDICKGLAWLGIELDMRRNWDAERVISAPASATVANVIPADEERVIARHCYQLLTGRQSSSAPPARK